MIRYYRDKAEKKKIINDVESTGLLVQHIDYVNEKGKATNGDSGRLTFEIEQPIPERVIKSLDELNLLLFKKRIDFIELLDLLTIQALSPTRWERFKARFSP